MTVRVEQRREDTLPPTALWQRLSPSVICWEYRWARCNLGNEVICKILPSNPSSHPLVCFITHFLQQLHFSFPPCFHLFGKSN